MKSTPEPLPVERINWLKIVMPLLASVVLGVVLFAGLDFTGKSSFCGNCHAMKVYVKTWSKGKHKGAACVDCHQEPGVIGALIQRMEMIKDYSLISIYFQRQRPTLAASVSTVGCLKCHGSINHRTIVTTKGIRVSHKEIIAAGLSCGRCHANIAHFSKAAKAARPAHAYCFACHQKLAGGGECSFCHTRDIGDKGPNQIDNYRKVEFNLNDCRSCHAANTCPICHPQGRQLEAY